LAEPQDFDVALGLPGGSTEQMPARVPTVKLCDFGTSQKLPPQIHVASASGNCTLAYSPPERLTNHILSCEGDVWGLGVCLYTMLWGRSPFRRGVSDTDSDIKQRIVSMAYDQSFEGWERRSGQARGLIGRLVASREARMSVTSVLGHTWFTNVTISPGAPPRAFRRGSPPPAAPVIRYLIRFGSLDPFQVLLLLICARLGEHTEVLEAGGVDWREAFLWLDVDLDGRLSFSELRDGLAEICHVVAEPESGLDIHDLCSCLDTDGSNSVEWTEWLALAYLAKIDRASATQSAGDSGQTLGVFLDECVLSLSIAARSLQGSTGRIEADRIVALIRGPYSRPNELASIVKSMVSQWSVSCDTQQNSVTAGGGSICVKGVRAALANCAQVCETEAGFSVLS